ncbi:MAG: ATP-binding protein [Bacillota bacterium]
MLKLRSIRSRMTITYLLLVAAVMLLTGLIVLHMLESYHLTVEEENLERTGKLVSSFISPYLRREGGNHSLSAVAANFARQINARVIIVDEGRLVVGDSRGGELLGNTLDRPEIEEALQGRTGRSVQYSRLSQQQVLQVAVPLEDENGRLGAVFFAASLNSLYETLAAVRRFFIFATLLAMALTAGLGALFAHHIGGPIKELTTAARRLAAGNMDQKIPVTSRDEIGELAIQFNSMADSLKEMKKRLTRFVADVSHELRTPLASIHICLQSLQHYQMNQEEQQEFLEDINQETQRLIYLVEDLLELTRREEVADKREIIPLKVLIDEVLDVTIPRAARKELQLFTHIPDMLPYFNISPDAFKRVLFNVLDNAIKFTPAGGWLKFSVELGKKDICITVQDTGCGIPTDELPFIFERFYRVDQARSRHLGGTGLGLAICKEIVELYGGTIGVQSQEEEGSTFYFTLPLEHAVSEAQLKNAPSGYNTVRENTPLRANNP